MRATLNLPPSVRLIEAALEGLVQVNRVLIETGVVPSSPLDSDVRYKRERSGLEEWDNAIECVKRGWGDCEDLNAWECARINIEEDEWAVCTIIQTGRRTFHCIVRMSDGSARDVCPALGMTVPGTSLEGIPWVDTRAENIIGAKGYVPKKSGTPYVPSNAAYARRMAKARKPYTPKPSSTPRGGRGGSEPYQPKSSRPDRRPPPEAQDPVEEAAQTATQMVSPTSQQTPEMMMPMPMAEEFVDEAEALETAEDVDPDEGEEFDEEMEDEV